MFFVDSKGLKGKDNKISEDEIVALLTWARQKAPIDVEKVKDKVDPVYKTVEEEYNETEHVIGQERNIQRIELRPLKRYKRVTYTGETTYTDWEPTQE